MDNALKFLEIEVKIGRLGHAFLLFGSPYLDKLAIADSFVKILECDPLDFMMVEPEIVEKKDIKKQADIGLEKINNLRHWASLFPYKSPHKIAVINQVERMTIEASNALLKTLEEPPSRTIFILITSFPNLILPTIISRCEKIKLPAPALKKIFCTVDFSEKYQQIVKNLRDLLKADLTVKYKYAEKLSKNTAEAKDELKFWLVAFRDSFLSKIGCADMQTNAECAIIANYSTDKLNKIMKTIKNTDTLLTNPSINAKLALEVLMLEL